MKEVEVEALKPFNRTNLGDLCEPGDRFLVGEVRAGELDRLGLARPTAGLVKAAPVPDNKMAAEPANKAAPAPNKFARTGFSNRRPGKAEG